MISRMKRGQEMKKRIVCFATLLFSFATALVWVQPNQPAMASQKTPYVVRGGKLFNQYCAACHGVTGKGDGPAAAALKVAPADLTAIQRPGEKFPFNQVQTKIDGEKASTAHGTSKMPIWGTVLRRTSGELQKSADIYALVRYIESIQGAK
jgi:mono/diheme cytochrome c family protein